MPVRRRHSDFQRDAVFLNGHLDFDAADLLAAIDAARAKQPVVPVLDPGRARTKQGYFWAMARDDRPWDGSEPPAVVYSYVCARQQAERTRRDTEAARTDAERRLRPLDLTAGEPVERTARRPGRPAKATNATTPIKPRDTARRGEAQPLAGVPEPEPVRLWLTSAKKTRRR
jgi:hypothetical protein